MTQKNTLDLLERSRLFASLTIEAKKKLTRDIRLTTLTKGQLLFSRGDAADAVYVVKEGELAIEVLSDQGRSIRMTTLQQGDVFGEIAVLDSGERTADARATKKTELLRVPKSNFLLLALEEAKFSFAIVSDLASKIRKTNVQVENISFQPLRVRLALLLNELAARADHGTINITQFEIADRLSATREKVNVHLQAIQNEGAIKIGRGKITICDIELLSSFFDTP